MEKDFWLRITRDQIITDYNTKAVNVDQGCALAEPGGPWCLTFVLGRLENLSFFIQIICWAP